MRRIGGRLRAQVLLRSFAIQGSWNYHTLIGAGFAFALLPVLRSLYGPDRDRLNGSIRRHAGLFNSHPYLATLALGAVARMEAEGEDPELVERFKLALRGSLGSLGDRLFWAGLRPLCLLAALVLFLLGAGWGVVIAVFLLTYNVAHLAARSWGLVTGLEEGRHVGERLRRSALSRLQAGVDETGPFLTGVAVPLMASGRLFDAGMDPAWGFAALAAALAAALIGRRARIAAVWLLVVLSVMGISVGVFG